MRTYIQLSGFDKNGFFETVATELRKAISDIENITFIPSDPDRFAKNDDYTARIFRWFHESGLNFTNYNVLDKRISNDEQKRLLQNAHCIFLMGGQTKKQLEYLKQQQLVPLIKKHDGVIVGISAGAINMSTCSVIANPLYPPTSTHDGIGLVETTIVPHLDNMTDDFIKSNIFPLSFENPIYCLCDDAIIVTKNNRIRHNGTIYKVSKGTINLLTDYDLI